MTDNPDTKQCLRDDCELALEILQNERPTAEAVPHLERVLKMHQGACRAEMRASLSERLDGFRPETASEIVGLEAMRSKLQPTTVHWAWG